jgi:hypothetical protein
MASERLSDSSNERRCARRPASTEHCRQLSWPCFREDAATPPRRLLAWPRSIGASGIGTCRKMLGTGHFTRATRLVHPSCMAVERRCLLWATLHTAPQNMDATAVDSRKSCCPSPSESPRSAFRRRLCHPRELHGKRCGQAL